MVEGSEQEKERVVDALLAAARDGDNDGTALGALPDSLHSIVDSFGFVQLIFMIEERLNIELDLEDTSLSELVQSASLVRFLRDRIKPEALPEG